MEKIQAKLGLGKNPDFPSLLWIEDPNFESMEELGKTMSS